MLNQPISRRNTLTVGWVRTKAAGAKPSREFAGAMANSLPRVFRTEGQTLAFIPSRAFKGTILNADWSGAWIASLVLQMKSKAFD
jgi:hypothetical protein